MLTLFGSIIGFASALLPNALEFLQRSQLHKHEKELLQLSHDIDVKKLNNEQQTESMLFLKNEMQALLKHDSQLGRSNTSPWVNSLRASVRPVITYAFFLLFSLVVMAKIAVVMDDNSLSIGQSLLVMWDEDARALFATIIAFWFGNRSVNKLK